MNGTIDKVVAALWSAGLIKYIHTEKVAEVIAAEVPMDEIVKFLRTFATCRATVIGEVQREASKLLAKLDPEEPNFIDGSF